MLGMYVHTHWAYNHPYAARTWTLADWEGYLDGLAALGYDFLMVWPQLDAMSPEPNASDRVFLDTVSRAMTLARARFGMRTAICVAANTIGNHLAPRYPFQQRPYFVCERKINPGDPREVAAFLKGRRAQLSLLHNADALAIIDSDPGGYIGSTNDEFVSLVQAQLEAFRSFNPDGEFIYWMLAGWESYNRFWQDAADNQGQADMWKDWKGEEFTQTLALMRDRVREPWWVYAWLPEHMGALERLGLRDKAMYFPYGLIEDEPSFPLTNCQPDALAAGLAVDKRVACPRGVMANAQTHCLQLPHTFAFACLARGGSRDTIDLGAFADSVVPGLGGLIAAGWRAIERRDPECQRAAAAALRSVVGKEHAKGELSGLLFGDADRFLTDLAINLELRQALADFGTAVDKARDVPRALRRTLELLRPYQQRVGFADAYGGPLHLELNARLARLGDPKLDAVLGLFTDWRDPTVRHDLALRLLRAADAYCREHGC